MGLMRGRRGERSQAERRADIYPAGFTQPDRPTGRQPNIRIYTYLLTQNIDYHPIKAKKNGFFFFKSNNINQREILEIFIKQTNTQIQQFR